MGMVSTHRKRAVCWVSVAVSFVLMVTGASLVLWSEHRAPGFSILGAGLVLMNAGAIGLACGED